VPAQKQYDRNEDENVKQRIEREVLHDGARNRARTHEIRHPRKTRARCIYNAREKKAREMQGTGSCAAVASRGAASTCVVFAGLRIGCAPWTPTREPVLALTHRPVCLGADNVLLVEFRGVVHNIMNMTSSWEGSMDACRHFVCEGSARIDDGKCMYWAQILVMSMLEQMETCDVRALTPCETKVHSVPLLQCSWKQRMMRSLCPGLRDTGCALSGGFTSVSAEFEHEWLSYMLTVWSGCGLAVLFSLLCCFGITCTQNYMRHKDVPGREHLLAPSLVSMGS